jgi:hypothetical protein
MPSILNPNPKPQILNPKFETLNLESCTLNIGASVVDCTVDGVPPTPVTSSPPDGRGANPKPKPLIMNPKPQTF